MRVKTFGSIYKYNQSALFLQNKKPAPEAQAYV